MPSVLRRFLFFIVCFAFFGELWPQAGNLKACLSKTKLVVDLYNNKQYPQIYQQLDSALQSHYSKEQFTLFLKDSLFIPGGKILKYDHKSQTQNTQIFIIEFEKFNMEFHLALNPNEEISELKFLPLREPPSQIKAKAASDNPLLTGLDSLVNNLCLEYMALPQTCGLSIGLTIGAERRYYHYGETQRGLAQLPNQQSVFEAGSITKTFTGLLLAQAIIEKKIDPAADIRTYLPGRYPNLAYGNTPITAIHLANHSSGLPRIPNNLFAQQSFDSLNPYKNYTEKMLYQDLRLMVIDQPPGSSSHYSNYGMAVLGKILELVYKKSYSELVQEKILNKLNMKNSCITLNTDLEKKLLPGYSATGTETKHWDLSVFQPAGALHSCTEDLLSFLDYQLVEPDSACKLSHKPSIDRNEKFGLAWQILPGKNKSELFWHNGATFGFSSFCGFIPESKISIVILSNASASTDYMAIHILRYLSKAQ